MGWRQGSLILGTVGLCLLGAMLPWLELSGEGVELGEVFFPLWALAVFVLLSGAPLVGLLLSGGIAVLSNPDLARGRIVAILVVGMLSFFGSWYGFLLPGDLQAWEYRPGARAILWNLAAFSLAGAILGHVPGVVEGISTLSRKLSSRWIVTASCCVALCASAAVASLILDGMPHMSDAVTYLMQGKVLWSGSLRLTIPGDAELIVGGGNGLFFQSGNQGHFGKYPIGWPSILGLFSTLGVPWLANPVLAAVIVFATYRLVRLETDDRYARLTAVFLAVNPWLWFNAGTLMSHLASTTWLVLFLWALAAARRNWSLWQGSLAGACFAMALITRPQDALFWGLPCVAFALKDLAVDWRNRWSTYVAFNAVACLGLAVYFGVNRELMGSIAESTYGGSLEKRLLYNPPTSPAAFFSWLHQSLVSLHLNSYLAIPSVVLCLAFALGFAWNSTRRASLLCSCSLSLFLCYGSLVIFISRPWVGPRWLAPLMPVAAYLVACVICRAEEMLSNERTRKLGMFVLSYLIAAFAIAWLVVTPLRIAELRWDPPHGVDGRVVNAVRKSGLANAVVALPLPEQTKPFSGLTYKHPRSAIWSMRVPLEGGDVIFVKQIPDWPAKAQVAFPGRALWWMDEKDNLDLHPLDEWPKRQSAEQTD